MQSEQTTHSTENGPALVIDGVNTDNVDGGGHDQEDGGADGLEQEEVRACLCMLLIRCSCSGENGWYALPGTTWCRRRRHLDTEDDQMPCHDEGFGQRGKGVLTDDCKLDRHVEPQDMEEDLQRRPLRGPEESPGPRGQHQGVPCGDGERADEEVLVGGQVGREVEGVGKDGAGVGHGSDERGS